ncbi:uncharacterized protein LOC106175483 [Lingula anatina]|uniref:Uncharacterized protein LOC106175483 n=1 Tax=Lingula anatina TaxID=7574 RepID=A0A1S3JRD2_LINAN|nr:uncharacterized protein LOC106175483 [Lingula anatina]|eukprot:XP_013412968.1 uncharacterized protein LOC106175483 [Lingula anatina]
MFSLRRAIIRNFGGWKYFIMWIVALSVAIYLIDSYLMPSRPVSKLLKDASATPGTVHVLKTGAAPLQSVPTAVLKVDKPKEGPKSTPAPKARPPEEPAKLEHHDNAPKKELKLVSKCHLRTPCEAGKFSFYIGSGHGKEDSGEQPVICIEDNFVINRENKKGTRGLTVVVVDSNTWHGWLAQLWGDSEMLVPEVSRVFRQQYEGSAEDAELMQALFNKPRLTNLDANVKVKGHEALTKDQYEQLLQNLIKTAEFVEGSTVTDCLNAKSDSVKLPDTSKGSYVLVYHQSSATDYQTLQVLAKCFHLFWYPKASPRGLHKGVLRFSNKGKPVLLVGSEGPYRSLIPTTYKLIKAP